MRETNYIRINTAELLRHFQLDADNLALQDGLRLGSSNIYIYKESIIRDASLDMADIAVDECDTVYFIDGGRDMIFSYDGNSGTIRDIGCRPGTLPVKLSSPSGLGIDKDTLYIADYNAVTRTSRIIALARSNLQIRWICSYGPEGAPLSEINDLTVGFGGHIYALEKSRKQVLIINRSGELAGALKNEAFADPTDIAVDDEGGVYVLDGCKVYIFDRDGSLKIIRTAVSLKGISVGGDGRIFAGEPGPFHLKKTIHKIMRDGGTIPIWSYRGAVKRLINDSRGNLYVIDDKGANLVLLEYTEVNTKNKDGIYKGVYISKPLDGIDDKNRWHRLLMEGEFPKGTQVEFSSFISDKLVPESEIIAMSEGKWKKRFTDTSALQGESKRDALFPEDINGRYLWFKISLFGDEHISPVVKTITVFFPRISWLDYLPAVYRENPASKAFLERFLSIFESLVYDTDFSIEHITRYFDAEGAPAGFLSWLGSWLSFSVDENRPEAKTRAFIQKAVHFYKMRGTRKGLQETLELFTGGKLYIVENFRTVVSPDKSCDKSLSKAAPADSIFLPPDKAMVEIIDDKGDIKEVPLKDVLFGKERFCFCVLLPASTLKEQNVEIIKRLIDEQKPAHTCYGLKALEPLLYLDMHTYLGINTCLTEPAFVLGKTSVIGRDTVLCDPEEAGQVGRRARAGMDTRIT